jgi:hypothetical protein
MTRIFLLASLALTGCANLTGPDVTRFMEPDVIATRDAAPATAVAGTCWAELQNTPVITSVTAQILTQSAPRSKPSPTIDDGKAVWFERPCDREMTPYFIENLQRALQVRGLYRREITGEMDTATRFAVRLYQQPLGLDSGVLSMAASRSLGLSRVLPDAAEQAAMDEEFPKDENALYLPEVDIAPTVPRPVLRP